MIELEPSTPRQRQKEIDRIINDMREKLGQLGSENNLRMNMEIKLDKPAASAPSLLNGERKPGAVYQPRRVGNDAGLWIIGTSWMRLAAELIERVEMEPESGRLEKIEKGIAYLQTGRADRGQGIFSALTAENSRDVLSWQGLAVSYVELGDISEAVSCYRNILDIEPENPSAAESIKYLEE